MVDKFESQNRHYVFPYHHIPHFVNGVARRTRSLGWGLEYLCYSYELKKIIESFRPNSVLDVGCGDGRLLGLLDSSIELRKGVDLSEEAIRFAKAFHPDVHYEVTDVQSVEGQFDVVTMIEVLEHIPDEVIPSFVEAAFSKLRPGGMFLVSVPTVVFPTLGKHYRHYDAALLRQNLESGGVCCDDADVRYLCPQREPLYVKLIDKLSFNRLWSFEFAPLQKFLWKWKWTHRYTTPEEGRHLWFQLEKS